MNPQTRALLQRAVDHYGEGAQLIKCMEELAELIQAVAKYTALPANPLTDAELDRAVDATDRIAEELADVSIMLDQLEMITDTHDRAARWRYRKLARLHRRIEGGGTGIP